MPLIATIPEPPYGKYFLNLHAHEAELLSCILEAYTFAIRAKAQIDPDLDGHLIDVATIEDKLNDMLHYLIYPEEAK